MAWVSTDKDVATSMVVTKTVLGQVLTGYPKTYSILSAFGSQGAITENTWRKMSNSQQAARIAAFKSYINTTEGVDVNSTQINDAFRNSATKPEQIMEE